jgi:hypothetical protein
MSVEIDGPLSRLFVMRDTGDHGVAEVGRKYWVIVDCLDEHKEVVRMGINRITKFGAIEDQKKAAGGRYRFLLYANLADVAEIAGVRRVVSMGLEQTFEDWQ